MLYSNPLSYWDPDGYESVSTMLENAELNADSAMGAFGYRFLSNLYHVGTLGFASVHDPQRDAYDEGKISGGEYLTKGVGGGTLMVGANIVTGRAAGAAMAGKGLATQTAIASGTGAVMGGGNDAAMQGSRISAGQQEEYNVGQTVTATAGGAVLGGAAPGAGVLVQKTANSLSKTKIGNFFTRESKGGPAGANGANQGALKGKSESVTRQSDATAVEVQQASSKSKQNARNYKTKEMEPEYFGENLPNNPVWPGSQVKYLDDAERQAHKVTIKKGKLYDSEGDLMDTTASHSAHSGQGKAIFVMDEQGNIYASNYQEVGRFHHSSFLEGRPVAAAGELQVNKGVCTAVTCSSGHYKPSKKLNRQVFKELESQGVDTSKNKLEWGF